MLERLKNQLLQRFSQANLQQMLRRFPLAFAYISLFTLWMAVSILAGVYGYEDLEFKCLYYLSTAAILDIALRLWSETTSNKRQQWCVYGALHLAWMGNLAYLLTQGDLSLSAFIANAASVFAMVAAVFVGSFWRSDSERDFHHFAIRVVGLFFKSSFICLVMTLGVFLLFLMVQMLLSIQVGSKAYALAALLCGWVSTCYFLLGLPQGGAEESAPLQPNRFWTGLGQYVILPLLCAYWVVIAIYGARILFTLTLPRGGVVWFITALVVGNVLMLSLLFAKRSQGASPLVERIAIWLPRLTLPLVALMSVAIGRRLMDYGVTVERMYVVAFNLWCYYALIYVALTRGMRLKHLITSGALVVLLTSVGWQNLTNVTSRILQRQLRTQLADTLLPMNEEALQQWLNTMEVEQAQQMHSKLFYLANIDKQAAAQLFDTNIRRWHVTVEIEAGGSTFNYYHFFGSETQIRFPEGMRTMRRLTLRNEFTDEDVKAGTLHLTHGDTQIEFDLEELKAIDLRGSQQPYIERALGDTAVLYFFSIQARSYNNTFEGEAYLFTK